MICIILLFYIVVYFVLFFHIYGRIRLQYLFYREALHSDRASAYLRSTASGFESACSDVEISFIDARAENAARFLC